MANMIDLLKTAFEGLDVILSFLGLKGTNRIEQIVTNSDTWKSTVGKGKTKRDFWDAFNQLTDEEKDTINELMDRLQLESERELEYFRIQVSLLGTDRQASVDMLKTIARLPGMEEMLRFIRTGDLTQPTTLQAKPVGVKVSELAQNAHETADMALQLSGARARAEAFKQRATAYKRAQDEKRAQRRNRGNNNPQGGVQ